jgi:hypothetical protein
MSLKNSNPYLQSRTTALRKAALRVSAKTSSAVEGIRAPFAAQTGTQAPATQKNFIAYWQQRAASNAR